MNCQKVRSFLSAFSEGLLSTEKANELEAHISNCKRCEQEKLYLEQMLAAAKALPKKSLPDDFNLKLFNRIYAEQGRPTESYLPEKAPSFVGRQLKWASALATVAVCALATVFVLKQAQTTTPTDMELGTPAFTSATTSDASVMRTSATSRAPEKMRAYDDILGVSGPTSNYRATNLESLRAFQINKAQIESLYVAARKKLGQPVIPAQYRTMIRNAGVTEADRYQTDRRFKYQQTSSR